MPPRFRHQAMRFPLTLPSSRAANRAPSSSIDSGSRGSGPAIALSKSAASVTLRPIGPDTDSGDHAPLPRDTRPADGRNPTTLQNAAGLRSEPPVSLPSAMGSMRAASDTAAPPLLPPHVFVTS